VLDWPRYFRSLAQAGFQGAVILHGFEEADAAPSLQFVRRVLEEVIR
jgi:sugar phosphate isomerase/epimerase